MVLNLALMSLSLIFMAILSEAALRFTHYRQYISGYTLRYYYKADDQAGFDIVENAPRTLIRFEDAEYSIWSNEQGCFDEPYNGEQAYILLVGDSYTHHYAPLRDKWGKRIEDLLDLRVLTCGVGGYGLRQEYAKAKKIISKVNVPPKLIMVGYYIGNDLEEDYIFPDRTVIDGYRVAQRRVNLSTGEITSYDDQELEQQYVRYKKYGTTGTPKHVLVQRVNHWLKSHSILYHLSRRAAKRILLRIPSFYQRLKRTSNMDFLESPIELSFRDRKAYPWLERAWESHLRNFMLFKKLADENSAKLLIVMIPTKRQVHPFLWGNAKVDPEYPNKLIEDFLEKENIAYIDLLPYFRKYTRIADKGREKEKGLYQRFGGHWNIRGDHFAGLLVAKHILESALLDVPDRNEKLRAIEDTLGHFGRLEIFERDQL